MFTATHSMDTALFRRLPADIAPRLAGLFLVAVLPAMFWMCVARQTAIALDAPLTHGVLVGIGGTVATFLAAVCAPLILKN